jgi:hypothetical protein
LLKIKQRGEIKVMINTFFSVGVGRGTGAKGGGKLPPPPYLFGAA